MFSALATEMRSRRTAPRPVSRGDRALVLLHQREIDGEGARTVSDQDRTVWKGMRPNLLTRRRCLSTRMVRAPSVPRPSGADQVAPTVACSAFLIWETCISLADEVDFLWSYIRLPPQSHNHRADRCADALDFDGRRSRTSFYATPPSSLPCTSTLLVCSPAQD